MDCLVNGCLEDAETRGWCGKHYTRWKRHGDPEHVARVVTRGTVEERFWAKTDQSGDCWLWTAGRHRQGYGQFKMDRGTGSWKTVMAHRVAWEITNGEIPSGLMVCHHCDNPPCVNPGHLFLGTARDNTQDSVSKGRHPSTDPSWHLTRRTARGKDVATSKLCEEAVASIRDRYAQGGVTQQALANEFGVNQSAVSKIVRRQTWAQG